MCACLVQIQRGTLKRLHQAYQRFFHRGNIGLPRFKSRRFLTRVSIAEKVKVRGITLHIPGYSGLTIRCKGANLYPNGTPVSVMLKRAGLRWYVTVCCEVNIPAPIDNSHVIGLDRNGGQMTDSDGLIHSQPPGRHLEGKIKRVQLKASRQRKTSHRRWKTIRRIAKARRQQTRICQHHVSRNLATGTSIIFIERLQTQGMTSSARERCRHRARTSKREPVSIGRS